jgi:hypothetical protein
MRQIWIVAGFALVLPTLAAAQHHGGMMGSAPVAARPAVAAAPHMAASAPHPAARVSTGMHMASATGGVSRVPVARTPTHRITITSGLTNLPLFPSEFGNVPGLGFDFPHLAAVSGGRLHHGFGRFGQGGFGFGGFLLSPSVIVEGGGEGQPAPVEEAQAANPAPEGAADLSDQFLPSPGVSSPAPRETQEYVFVRRDGGLLFAVGYSWENGMLRYVTRDGIRRSVSRDSLDIDATQQFNEQRGLSFRVPA